ncbi:hypothetical protein [Methylocucumis oryzae]|nr:hypothetical protein [Methylocucumis oryzae]
MNTFTSSKKAILAVASLMALTAPLFPSVAHAIPTGLYYMVSPVSCVPASATDAGKVSLVNGAWTFKNNQTGTANLNCPISFSGNTDTIDTVILSFRDDWLGNRPYSVGEEYGYVQADLMFRNRSSAGATKVLPINPASSYAESDANYGYFVLSHEGQPLLSQHPALGNIYYLNVKMHRPVNNANWNVAFTGFEIRF